MRALAFWPIAAPAWDVPTPAGDAAPVAGAPPVDDGGSLSDHEAAYHSESPAARPAAAEPKPAAADKPPASAAEPAVDTPERDETGKFKPRHRAKSQEASPEDVPRIAALTKRLREAEAERDALRTASRPAEPAPKPAEPRAEPAREKFPTFEKWFAEPANKDKDFDDWIDERSQFNYSQLRSKERADEAKAAEAREWETLAKAYDEKLAVVQKKYPDYEEIVAAAPRVSAVVEMASIQVGPEVVYYLATHPDEAEALTNDTLVPRDDPAFKATVAATRRYLQTLVASEQRSEPSSRTAAGSTGAALALVSHSTPKPPTPVRTGAMRDTDTPPGDDSDLSAHEKAYYRPPRRA